MQNDLKCTVAKRNTYLNIEVVAFVAILHINKSSVDTGNVLECTYFPIPAIAIE